MTKKLYLDDTYAFDFQALIQSGGNDEKGVFILLDQTAFYPQGGGQPSDHGLIKSECFEWTVIHVAQRGDDIRHYVTSQTDEIPEGSKVYCQINQEKRLLNARYHTAAHLLGNQVEVLHPTLQAVKGHSFPGEAYVEFQGEAGEINAASLESALNEAIARKDKTTVFDIEPKAFEGRFYTLPYSVPDHKKFRAMQIGDLLPVPCGGTHLSDIGEIGSIKVSKIKPKSNCVRISYQVI